MYQGIAESLIVGFVNFGALAGAWLLVAAAVLRAHQSIPSDRVS